jgi:hypothetical protein
MTDGDYNSSLTDLVNSMPSRRTTVSAPIQHIVILACDTGSADCANRLISEPEFGIPAAGSRVVVTFPGVRFAIPAFVQQLQVAEVDIIVLEAGSVSPEDLSDLHTRVSQLPAKPTIICCPDRVSRPIVAAMFREAERRRKHSL